MTAEKQATVEADTLSLQAHDRESGSARAMAPFIAIFLSSTLLLLAGYNFTSHTIIWQRYLHAVAIHTSWLLDHVAWESRVEGGTPDRESASQTIRADLARWRGEPEPRIAGNAPVTSWERYLHRAMELQRERDRLLEMQEVLSTDFAQESSAPEARLDVLEKKIAAMERAASVLGPAATVRGEGMNLATMALSLADKRRETAEAGGVSPEALAEIAMHVEALRERQISLMEVQLERYRDRIANDGPLVEVVLRPGLDTRLDKAREDLAQQNLSSSARAHLDSQIAALELQRNNLLASNDTADLERERSFRFTIVPECGAIPSMAIYVAAVLGFPCIWRKRLLGIMLGVPALYIINILRLTCLALLGAWDDGGEWFDFAHHYVWQGIYLVFVVGIWLLWVEFSGRRKLSHD